MSLANVDGLWRQDIAHAALLTPTVVPLKLPGWECQPYDVQTRGITWLYGTPRAVLADRTGMGKTIQGVGLVALLRAKQEMRRAVFVVLSGTVGQWLGEFGKFLPDCQVVTSQGLTKSARSALYKQEWDVLVTSYSLMWRDASALIPLQPDLLVFDESTSFRNPETRTAVGARRLAAASKRIVAMSATPIQNGLEDLFAQLEVLGLAGHPDSSFGTIESFSRRYLVRQPETFFVRGGGSRTRMKTVGYQNLDELRDKLAPFLLRRVEGSGDMPSVVSEDVVVPMTSRQTDLYDELRSGSINGEEVDAAARLTYMLQCSAGAANLGADDESGKLDWIMDALERRFVDDAGSPEKVVIFSRWLGTISALQQRLTSAGIKHGVISGEQSGSERDEVRASFWDDPDYRVVIITTAGEMGLNLQVAAYVVCIDLLWNPARLEQILGRVKRSGSPHSHVFMLRLISPGTVEEGILRLLASKQALADYVNGDESDLFRRLSDVEMETLIQTRQHG